MSGAFLGSLHLSYHLCSFICHSPFSGADASTCSLPPSLEASSTTDELLWWKLLLLVVSSSSSAF